jgi:hypothetical protein
MMMKTRKTLTLVAALTALALVAGACSKAGGATPTETAKAFYEASKSKDVAGLKNNLSKGSIAMMESFAQMSGKSLDDFLKDPNSSKPPGAFEARNEVITGDTATLEVKDEKGGWDKIPFVKENGQWKIALDKAFEQGLSEMGSEKGTGGGVNSSPAANANGNANGNAGGNTGGNANGAKSEEDEKENGNDSDHGGH